MYAYLEEHSIDPLMLTVSADNVWSATVPTLEAGAYSIVLVAADVTNGDDDWTVHAYTDYWIDLTVTT